MKRLIPTAIAIGVGLVTLASYLISIPTLTSVRLALTNWAVVLAGLAVLIGVINLALVQARRIDAADPGWVYSFFTLVALLFTIVIGVFESFRAGGPVLYEPASFTNVLFRGVIVSSLAALSSLVMFFLVAAAVRMLRNKPGGWSVLFLVTVIIALVGWIPLAIMAPVNSLYQWLVNVPAVAGGRGILIGVSLGTLVMGLRVLTGSERPYQD